MIKKIITIKDLLYYLNSLYPLKQQDEWDKSGFFGNINVNLNNIIICLDLTLEIIKYASLNNVNLILTHHPIFLDEPIRTNDLYNTCIKNNICCVSFHTNLDKSTNGINKLLGQLINLKNIKRYKNSDYIWYGNLNNKISVKELAKYIKSQSALNFNISYDEKFANKLCKKIAWCAGSGSDFIPLIINDKSIDLFLTGDMKYHTWMLANHCELAVIDINHMYEYIFIDLLHNILRKVISNQKIYKLYPNLKIKVVD